jgi:hypothetical protein
MYIRLRSNVPQRACPSRCLTLLHVAKSSREILTDVARYNKGILQTCGGMCAWLAIIDLTNIAHFRVDIWGVVQWRMPMGRWLDSGKFALGGERWETLP